MGLKTPVPKGDFFRQPLRASRSTWSIRWCGWPGWEWLNHELRVARGRPPASPRLIAGLLYLQHAFDLSGEHAVWQWLENSYWRLFTGQTYLQTKPPVGRSSLTRRRKRLGEAGDEEFSGRDDRSGQACDVIKASSRVIVETTATEKSIEYPMDSHLLERRRDQLVKTATQHGPKPRQNYDREAPRLTNQIGRYAHAKQYKRMKNALRTLLSHAGRVMRDVERPPTSSTHLGPRPISALHIEQSFHESSRTPSKFYASCFHFLPRMSISSFSLYGRTKWI
ncbi:hypothetical protein DM82_5628 [Burkholderia oklahomensis]|uniref:Transposase InsH N-terminal domain-containing protein n=1 Tax=Burkholderia oklahomensis TaxID=342113 RepID=A0AAI8FQS4_9BURK|nr:hypothetical protein DM82_5628 [Burkholderia oklahomensis]QPS40659.1 IS5/IS1182 family transposase [Burkholderia oklahomensis]